MDIEIETIAREELNEWNWIIDEVLKIPDHIFRECGSAAFSIAAGEDAAALPEGSLDLDHATFLNDARERFTRLCEAAPHVSPDCIRWLSMGCTTISTLFDDRFEPRTTADVIRTLMSTSTAKGMVIASLPKTQEDADVISRHQHRKMLALAGQKGAKIRNQPYADIKEWALKEASSMRGADRDVARKLSAQMPLHLADASKDPMRLIYEALRAPRSSK
ncbi:MAG: hypothetical protein Q7T21_15655 [Gallionella sp.]|nr:hypothetical protein [Gallionella sp.]